MNYRLIKVKNQHELPADGAQTVMQDHVVFGVKSTARSFLQANLHAHANASIQASS